jgi:hypothetical protein
VPEATKRHTQQILSAACKGLRRHGQGYRLLQARQSSVKALERAQPAETGLRNSLLDGHCMARTRGKNREQPDMLLTNAGWRHELVQSPTLWKGCKGPAWSPNAANQGDSSTHLYFMDPAKGVEPTRKVLLCWECEQAHCRLPLGASLWMHEFVAFLLPRQPLLNPVFFNGLEAGAVGQGVLTDAQHRVVVLAGVPAEKEVVVGCL